MREVLPELLRVVARRRARRRRHRRRDVAVRPAPAGRVDARRARGRGRRLGLRRLRRGRGLRARPVGRRSPATPALQRYGVSDEDAYAVGLTCGGILDVWVEKVVAGDLPRARRRRRRHRGRPPGRGGHRRRAPRPVAGSAGGWSSAPRTTAAAAAARSAAARLDDAVTDDALGLLASGHNETLTYGPDGERRGEGMRVFVVVVRAGAADAGLRRHRLRRGRAPGWATSSATR